MPCGTSFPLGRSAPTVQSDIDAVLIYRDNGDGVFQPAVDTRVSVATMTFDASGQVNLTLTSPETVSAGLPKSYWVVVRVDPAGNIGATVQTRLANVAAVHVLTGYTSVAGNFPLTSAVSTISPTVGTLNVTPTDLTPPTVLQGATNVAMLKLQLGTTQYTVPVLAIRVDRTGTGADSDITKIKIYQDSNGDGVFEGRASTRLSRAATTPSPTARRTSSSTRSSLSRKALPLISSPLITAARPSSEIRMG